VSAEIGDVEALLRSALVPIEPSERMTDRLERSLTDITDIAAGELADWEIGAMRDPRNWGRPAAAVVIGGVAAGGLVLVRARQARRRDSGSVRALERSLRQVASDIQDRLER
jgi:hypothetical protein